MEALLLAFAGLLGDVDFRRFEYTDLIGQLAKLSALLRDGAPTAFGSLCRAAALLYKTALSQFCELVETPRHNLSKFNAQRELQQVVGRRDEFNQLWGTGEIDTPRAKSREGALTCSWKTTAKSRRPSRPARTTIAKRAAWRR